MDTIYLDNAATSFPKPETVARAMARYIHEVGAPLNRSVYESAQEAELTTLSLREQLKGFFQPSPCAKGHAHFLHGAHRIFFIFQFAGHFQRFVGQFIRRGRVSSVR